mmetsp:Transcript_16929/g.49187  ORF Transcript_16929/g.49187 Transcript_16929/m.49187 type:complete len:110 (+) Transcript_16929:289-618(+)
MSRTVTLRLETPIGTSHDKTGLLLLAGIVLASYPIVWMVLSKYYEPASSAEVALPRRMLDIFAWWILDVTPALANGGMSLFLSSFFFTMAYQKQKSGGLRNRRCGGIFS